VTNKRYTLVEPATIVTIVLLALSLAPVVVSGVTATIQEVRKLYEEIKRWK
jgi:hypothetical protein